MRTAKVDSGKLYLRKEVSISSLGGARLLEFQQELPARHDPDSVDEEPFLPPVEQQPLRLRVILPKSFQPTKVRRMDGSRVLHLDRTEDILPVEDEIDFIAGAGPPVIQGDVRPPVIDPCQKVLRHQTLLMYLFLQQSILLPYFY